MNAAHILLVAIEFTIVLGIMVLVHEFGHFAMAKLCGVRVETFSIGFGPRIIGIKRGDTDYRLSLLPLGGYVKMAGDNDNPAERRLDEGIDLHGADRPHDPAEFNARPRWQRVLIALAGPFANFILSLFLLTLVGMFHHTVDEYLDGPAVVDYVPTKSGAAAIGIAAGDTLTVYGDTKNPTWTDVLNNSALNLNRDLAVSWRHNGEAHSGTIRSLSGGDDQQPDPSKMLPAIGLIPREQAGPIGVYSVAAGTPAERAGLLAGDQLSRINDFAPHSVAALLAYLQDEAGKPSTLTVLRSGQTLQLPIVPEKLDNGTGSVAYRIGFTNKPSPAKIVHLPFFAAVQESFKDNLDDSRQIFKTLKSLVIRHVSVKALSGPVGIAQEIDMATQFGIWTVLRVMSMISINLGIFNLLPMPLLDGGMIIFLLWESIIRRDVSIVVKERVYQVAFVCLIMFAVFVLFNDITKLHIHH
ncbi:RIP metalloprotease RseP [Granulicella cerasi]|uniref:RIP metalloprotease RseP n=1 Tax=Granulicella cerasi TaxID=741063 RepID=UPI0021E056A1|nr:RIP metalloprotease RseP [Granulicella cerasi]